MKRILILPLAAVLLSGCGVVECIDAQIPRSAEQLKEPITVEIAYAGAEVVRREIRCERYYDAQCSERGNRWSIRQAGAKDEHEKGLAKIIAPQIGEIVFDLPLCNYVHQGRVTTLKWVHPRINGELYSYVESHGQRHLFRTRSGNSTKTIELQFDYKINGVSLAPKQS
jgi:hypothetical protein